MFCGAKLGANKDFALFDLLDHDCKRVTALQNDARLMLLKDDIKRCWQVIEAESMGVIKNEGGRKIALNSKRKWNRYFDLERLVLNSVRAYLTKQGLKFFLEHDGWRTDQAIDVEALQSYVFHSTGYQVKITVTSSEALIESFHEDFDGSLLDDTSSISGVQRELQQIETQERITRCSNYPIVLKVNADQRACENATKPTPLARLRTQLTTNNRRPGT